MSETRPLVDELAEALRDSLCHNDECVMPLCRHARAVLARYDRERHWHHSMDKHGRCLDGCED